MCFHEVIKNISYSFLANIIALSVSISMVLIVPKFLSLENYGMWQLFLFYFSYLGFLHFGWEDGIYLRYAGNDFDELPSKRFSGQFYAIVILQVVIALIVSNAGKYIIFDFQKRSVLLCSVWLAPFVNFENLCIFILQITNRIKKYAKLLALERFMLLVIAFFLIIALNRNSFYDMYTAQAGASIIATAMGALFCRKLFVFPPDPLKQILQEAKENIAVGSKLMTANIANMLIIGIVRYGISWGWDVATFGKVSLTLGISNFLMVFINSVSVVFFPIVKRMDPSRRETVYLDIRNTLTFILFGGLLFYYPIRSILAWWLPQYADSLVYMSILFPVCVFESKMGLLINTYLKSMRQETLMLKINIISVMVSAIVTWFTVAVFHNLDIAIFSVVFLYAFRCLLAEFWIGKLLHLQLYRKMVIDCGMCAVFILSGWCFDNVLCMAIYGAFFVLYAGLHYKELKTVVRKVRA